MSVYSNIEVVIKEIYEALSDNEEFLQLVSNDGANALSIPSSKTFNELVNGIDGKGKRLYLTPKKLNPAIYKGTYVMTYFNNGSRSGTGNVYFNDLTFTMDFLCHEDVWEMDDWKIRSYRLMDVIKKELENIETVEAVRGRLDVGEPRIKNDYFYLGYSINFKITGATDLMCKSE
jgi:hypothetical protein